MSEENKNTPQITLESSVLFAILFTGILASLFFCYKTLLIDRSYTIFTSEKEIENVDIHLTDVLSSLWNK